MKWLLIILSLFFHLHLPSLYSEQKPITVVVLSHNAADCCEANLKSLIRQQYTNFKVVYVDDASSDGTPDRVQNYLNQYDSKKKVTLVRNPERLGALASIALATKTNSSSDIIMVMNSADRLYHEALQNINLAYSDTNLWMTYNRAIESQTASIKLDFCTFYAWLFQNIRQDDFRQSPDLYEESKALSSLFPLLEMAGSHSRFLPTDYLLLSSEATRSQSNYIPLEESYALPDAKGTPLDLKLLELLNIENGIFVEAGAVQGILQSNTKLFENRLNWTGILIEPCPMLYEQLCLNRPKSRCFSCALGSFEEDGTFVQGDFDGSSIASIHTQRQRDVDLVTVPVRSLQSILDECEIRHVNLFSLDTEGYELNILKGIDFSKTSFDYLLIESSLIYWVAEKAITTA